MNIYGADYQEILVVDIWDCWSGGQSIRQDTNCSRTWTWTQELRDQELKEKVGYNIEYNVECECEDLHNEVHKVEQ